MEFIPFVTFSMLDSLALIVVVLTLYRFKLSDCLWPSLLIAAVMSLQSFTLREELFFANLVPFVNVLLLALLLTVLLQVPIHWSFIGSFGGYFAYILFQAISAEVSTAVFSISIEDIKASPIKGYIFQVIVSMLAFLICHYCYSRGWGYGTKFKKRFKYEPIVVAVVIVVATLTFGILLIRQQVILDLIVVAVAMVFFIVILLKKELSK